MAAGRLRRLFEKLEPSERKAIVYTTFAAAIVTFLPGEWEAGVVLLGLTYIFFRTNRELFRRPPKEPPPPPAETSFEDHEKDDGETASQEVKEPEA